MLSNTNCFRLKHSFHTMGAIPHKHTHTRTQSHEIKEQVITRLRGADLSPRSVYKIIYLVVCIE